MAAHVLGAGGDEPGERVFGNVVVVEVEGAGGDALGIREGVQFGETAVADEVGPEPIMGVPARVVDQNGHTFIVGIRDTPEPVSRSFCPLARHPVK